jgi:hypothetical protein
MSPLAWGVVLLAGAWGIVWAWVAFRAPEPPPTLPAPDDPDDLAYPDYPDDPWAVWELWNDALAQHPEVANIQSRMDDIERIADRDGLQCGVCHTPAPYLYYIPLHDDGTLCCAVCAQLLDAGALE